jgi:hypothetical protein
MEIEQVDDSAKVARFVTKHITKRDFISLFPESHLNAARDRDDPDQPYSHIYKRYLGYRSRCGMRIDPAIPDIDEWTWPRFVMWYKMRTGEPVDEKIVEHWAFLRCISRDMGMSICFDMHGDDRVKAEAMFDRFVSSGRDSAIFWSKCDLNDKERLLAWYAERQRCWAAM